MNEMKKKSKLKINSENQFKAYITVHIYDFIIIATINVCIVRSRKKVNNFILRSAIQTIINNN